MGHIAEACMSKSARQPNMITQLTPSPCLFIPFPLVNMESMLQYIELNNQSVLMELDIRAGLSIISEKTYAKYFKGVVPQSTLSAVPQSCMLTLVTPFMFLVSSMLVPDTSLSLQPFPSLLMLVLDPNFWEEIGSLKFVFIGTKSSAYMLLKLQFRPMSLKSCILSFKTTQIYSRMNSELLKDCLPDLN